MGWSERWQVSSLQEMSLKTAIQYLPLNQEKAALAQQARSHERSSIIRKQLVGPLIEFELTKRAQLQLPSAPAEPSAQQLEQMLDHLLHLDTTIERFNLSHLVQLHRFLVPEDQEICRQHPIAPLSPLHEPLPPALIASALSRFFEWSQSPAFAELHAVEQMTLSQMRLYEIYPFECYSEITVSFFSYYFLLADGYLLPSYQMVEGAEFCSALNAAFDFSTQNLINLNLRACQRAYDRLSTKF